VDQARAMASQPEVLGEILRQDVHAVALAQLRASIAHNGVDGWALVGQYLDPVRVGRKVKDKLGVFPSGVLLEVKDGVALQPHRSECNCLLGGVSVLELRLFADVLHLKPTGQPLRAATRVCLDEMDSSLKDNKRLFSRSSFLVANDGGTSATTNVSHKVGFGTSNAYFNVELRP